LAECLIINFEVIVMITGKIVGSSAIQVAIEREVEVYKGIIVIKRDGRREYFDINKLRKSILKAIEEVDEEFIDESDDVLNEVLNSIKGREVVYAKEIADTVERVFINKLIENWKWEEIAKRFALARIYNQALGKGKWVDFDPNDLRLTFNAIKILESRYLLKDPETLRYIETPQMLFRRVAKAIAEAEFKFGKGGMEVKELEQEFYKILSELKFMPNSPTLMNAGLEGTLSACFVLPVRDSMTTPEEEGIMDIARAAALIFKYGGGCGYDFSELRPEGDVVASTSGVASGPLSFMKLFDAVTEIIKQGGKRRGANMGVLHIWHADVEKFIDAKSGKLKDVMLQNFNISVGVYDEFMRRALEGDTWPLVNPRRTKLDTKAPPDSRHYAINKARHALKDEWVQEVIIDELEEHGGSIELDKSLIITLDEAFAIAEAERGIIKEVDASQLLDKIVRNAWDSGDPGLLFIDTINERHPVWYLGKIKATNPCVTGDTLVLTPNGWVPIGKLYELSKNNNESIAECDGGCGSKLMGYPVIVSIPMPSITKSGVLVHLINVKGIVWEVGTRDVYVIKFDDGTSLKATPDHKVAVIIEGTDAHSARKVWKEVSKLKVGDRVWSYSEKGYKTVKEVKYLGKEIVYDITVPGLSMYLTNGIFSHNCGEVPALEWESCNLGSINLAKYVYVDEDGRKHIDWKGLAEDVKLAIRFLDNVIEANRYPIPSIEKATKRTRKIGLGVMGWAHMLIKLGIPYDSIDALYLGYALAEWIEYNAVLASIELAKERGPFPAWNPRYYRPTWRSARRLEELLDIAQIEGEITKYTKRLVNERPKIDWSYVDDLVMRFGLRNAAVTSIAPTGTISIISGASSSIEPIFALAFVRRVSVGTFIEIDRLFLKDLRKYELDDPEVIKAIAETGSIVHNPFLPRRLRIVYKTAHDVDPIWHVMHQAVWQQWVDQGVSKTVNLRADEPPETVYNVYILAWRLGCKGITVYRDKSKAQQVIYFGIKMAPEAQRASTEERRGEERIALKRFRVNGKEYLMAEETYAGGCVTCNIE